tara:strand:+ start:1476 stop:5465 length:3990 start_codon:yes stop_codon:yes gene_type:complete
MAKQQEQSPQNKRLAINEFLNGLDLDTNYLKLDNSVMVGAMNIRLLTEDGQGLVVTNIKGNEKKFELSTGFIPLGSCEYNGIAFIASVNPNNGFGEIGCYPSPCQFQEGCYESTSVPTVCSDGDPLRPGFREEYSPLMNYTGGVNPIEADYEDRQAFTTELLNFDCKHQIEMFARINYDKSVNLYITDFNNPIRRINNGFNVFTGGCVSSFYGNDSFPNGVSLFSNTSSRPDVSLTKLESNGQLLAGNWIFYFRYTTESFNSTDWIASSGPVQISPDDAFSAGLQTDGGPGLDQTTRSVTFDISNLDNKYRYIEVGFIYFYNGTWETGTIDKFYFAGTSGSTQITISGNETRLPIDVSELFITKQQYDVAKSITQFENRLFAANLKTTRLFDPSLAEFAKLIKPKFNASLTRADGVFRDTTTIVPGDPASLGEYKDPELTYNSVGYFRGETYAYAAVFVFTDGKESQAFPTRGLDDWDGTGTYTNSLGGVYKENDQGIYRFPNALVSTPYTPGQVRIMGVDFDSSDALAFGNDCPFISTNVVGFYITRAKRKPNLEMQGIGLQCVKPFRGEAACDYDDNQVKLAGGSCMPMWQTKIPYYAEVECGIGDRPDWTIGSTDKISQIEGNKYGIYSIDHQILDDFAGGSRFLHVLGTAVMNQTSSTVNPEPCLKPYMFEQTGIVWNPAGTAPIQHNTYNVPGWVDIAAYGFKTLYGEGNDPIATGWYYASSDSTIGTARYMSEKNLSFATGQFCGVDRESENLHKKIVNVYRANPDPGVYDIRDIYNPKNEDYYVIGNYIQLSNPVFNTYYQGDCFLQRFYQKQFFNGAGYIADSTEDGITGCNNCNNNNNYNHPLNIRRAYGFGIMHSIVTENTCNSAMRMKDGINAYFPELNLSEPEEYARIDYNKESNAYNLGYQETLSLKSYQGYDPNIPYVNKEFPTRIIYSVPHDPNSLTDNYGTVGATSFKDFDYRLGQINKIIDFNSKLMSVQERGINYHLVNERQLLNQTNSSQLLLGDGVTLDSKAFALTDMLGTQHQWSICKTDNAVYGVDFNKRKIWRVTAGSKGGLETISDAGKIRSWVTNTVDQYGNISDVTSSFEDNPICQEGIVTAFDRKNNELIFTFLYNPRGKQGTFKCTPEEIIANSKTIVFNEWLSKFVSERSYHSPFYLSISEDFYSVNPNTTSPIVTPPTIVNTDFYLHDVGDYITFYGKKEKFFIKFVVNDIADATKVFDNIQISSNGEPFEKIEYRTQDQLASHDPFVIPSEPYRDPRYQENLWKLPISRADQVIATTNNIYSVKSRLRGRWLEIELTGNIDKFQFIKSVITAVRHSKN